MDYTKLSLGELREVAASLGIEKAEKLKKAELLKAMEEILGPVPQVSEEDLRIQKLLPEAMDTNNTFGMTLERFKELDSHVRVKGFFEMLGDNYGFIRYDEMSPGERDIYVSPAQVRRYRLKTGDIIEGGVRLRTQEKEKYSGLLYLDSVSGMTAEQSKRRMEFDKMTPIFPDKRMQLEYPGCPVSLRILDLLSPLGKGQRGMIVAPPKAGKTTLLKQIATAISRSYPEVWLMVLLIDERPEEVTDIREAIEGPKVEVIYSTFDEQPEHHKRVTEIALERAKRKVEFGQDVVILLDSITRLTRAYNLTVAPSGRTLSGGLDPASLYSPKRLFGAARNMREGGSLTVLATALVETGSRMDDVVFEEFKGTGNMELVLDRTLSERRVFPAIDVAKSSTRNEHLLLSKEELEAVEIVRRTCSGLKAEEGAEWIVDLFEKTKDNAEFMETVKKRRFSAE